MATLRSIIKDLENREGVARLSRVSEETSRLGLDRVPIEKVVDTGYEFHINSKGIISYKRIE